MTGLLLAFARASAALQLLPVFGADAVPRWVAGLCALGFAALVAPTLADPSVAAPGEMLRALVFELLFGGLAGLVIRSSFAALSLAAELAAQQSGYGSVSLSNPVTSAQESPYGLLASLLGAATFLGTGQHLVMLCALAESFSRWPPGHPPGTPAGAVGLVLDGFTLGVQLAGPLLVGGLLLQLFVGLLTKVAPRLHAFFALGPPVTAGVGLWLFAASLPWLLSVHDASLRGAVATVASWLQGR